MALISSEDQVVEISEATGRNGDPDPQQGVIEDARRRQHSRRRRIAVTGALAAILAGAGAWVVGSGGAHGNRIPVSEPQSAVFTPTGRTKAFDIRLEPMLRVGLAGECWVVEEHGSIGESGCVPLPSRPLLSSMSSYVAGAHYETAIAITGPGVHAIRVDGKIVRTQPLPGLPYGLRGVRALVKPHTASSLVAIGADGRTLTEHRLSDRARAHAILRSLRSWQAPQQPPRGVCGLQSTLSSARAAGGKTLITLPPVAGSFVGHAFLACAYTTYELGSARLTATVTVDAANPGAMPAALPDFKPVRNASGVYDEGGLTAKRSGRTWIFVEGAKEHDRTALLRGLTATVAL